MHNLRSLPLILTFMVAQPALALRPAESAAVVQIHPAMITISPTGNPNSPDPGMLHTRSYMENEIEAFNAPATLEAAAKALNLDLKKDKEALTQLKKSITVSPRRGTDFLEIKVRHKDPKQAAAIANALVDAYMTRRNEFEKQRAETALKALDEELLHQSKLVQANRPGASCCASKLFFLSEGA